MTVRIDTLTSEVVVEPQPAPAQRDTRHEMDWEEGARAAAHRARALRDQLRTRAEAYDD